MTVTTYSFGAYFSANDAVLSWAEAFLNSFRAANPHMPLYLIPFGEQTQKLRGMADRDGFLVFEDISFKALDELGKRFDLEHSPNNRHWFRRYAAFWGPLDHFWYLDVRQLILSDIAPYLEDLDRLGLDVIHYDTAINQVYEPGGLRDSLVSAGRGRGFNSGRWLSRKGLFTLDELIALGDAALKIRDQLNRRNTDQAFFNYCCDTKSVRTAQLAELHSDLASNTWARSHRVIYKHNDNWLVWDHGGLDHRKRLILLHWAGIKESPIMPHRKLFRAHRDACAPLRTRLLNVAQDKTSAPFLYAFDKCRRNRLLNVTYKQIFPIL